MGIDDLALVKVPSHELVLDEATGVLHLPVRTWREREREGGRGGQGEIEREGGREGGRREGEREREGKKESCGKCDRFQNRYTYIAFAGVYLSHKIVSNYWGSTYIHDRTNATLK